MAVNISNVLANDGHKVLLISSREKGPLIEFLEEKVEFKFLGKRSLIDLVSFGKLIRCIITFKPEIIHAHSSSIYWVLIIKQFLYFDFKVLFHDHFGLSEQIKENDRTFLRYLSGNIYGCIAVNSKLAAWSNRNLSINSEKIVVINNFPLLKNDFKRKYQTGQRQLVITCLSNFRPQKDHLNLIRAIEILVLGKNKRNFKVLLVGEYQKDSYFNSIVKEIKERDLTKWIEIIGPVKNVSKILSNTDIGVLSSSSEGLPVSLLEYGLAGLPTVVTNVGQCAEVVKNGNLGKLVEPNNSVAFADALNELIDNPILMKKLGSEFRNSVIDNFGYKNFLEAYFRLIKSK